MTSVAVKKDWDWWRSDDAVFARLAKYVALILWSNEDNRREEFSLGKTPDWPAVFHYDPETDAPFWVECKAQIHARDFLKGCDERHVNIALRKLAA